MSDSKKPDVQGIGSPQRGVKRSKRVDRADDPASRATYPGPRAVHVQPSDLPDGDRISVTVENKERLAKIKSVLEVRNFSQVYNIALRRLARQIEEEGKYKL